MPSPIYANKAPELILLFRMKQNKSENLIFFYLIVSKWNKNDENKSSSQFHQKYY